MNRTLGIFLLSIASLAVASPSSESRPQAFTLDTLTGPNGPQYYFKFSAIKGSIFADKPNSDALCEGGGQRDYATFILEGDELFLYSNNGVRQQVYGTNGELLGAVGYVSEGEEPPAGATLKGWGIDSKTNEVRLNGKRFRGWADAITSTPDDMYQMFISEIDDIPEGYTAWGGIMFKEESALSCEYS